jgi:glycosyltransferase involved in cell wall biosynthesis
MRIAFTFLTYGKNVFGGIENALFNLTQGLKENGHDVAVFTSDKYIKDKNYDLPAKIYISQYLPSHYDGSVTHLVTSLKQNATKINTDFDKFLIEFKPEVIVVVDPIWGILQVTNHILDIKTPIYMSYHIANKWHATSKIMRDSFILPYKGYFAVSEFLITDIKSTFLEAKNLNIGVLPNSIDPDLYSNRIAMKENYIFCNSRIAKGKDVDVLVRAFKTISDYYDINLKLCSGKFPFGDTSADIKEIEMLIEQLDLKDKVELLPLLDWDKIPEVTMNAKIVVLPSSYETFGIAALEASIAGIPLIVADATNFKHLVKDSALFFEPGNKSELEYKIREMISNYSFYENKAKNKVVCFTNYFNKEVAERFVFEISNYNVL